MFSNVFQNAVIQEPGHYVLLAVMPPPKTKTAPASSAPEEDGEVEFMLQTLQDDIFDAACEKTVIVGLKADRIEIVTPTSLLLLTLLLVTKGRAVDYGAVMSSL